MLHALRWSLSSALELLRLRQFGIVRCLVGWALELTLVGWALQLTHTEPRVENEHADCARVAEILHRRKLPVSLASVSDFILGRARAVPPEAVLVDNVSLYCISEHEAVFVEVPPGCDVYACASAPSPFLFDAQFELATRVIRMPLQALMRLSSQVEFEPASLLLLSNTTRCGSMLLCDLLEGVPGMRVLREPDALTCMLALGALSLDAQRAIVRAVLRMLCKPTRARPAAALRAGEDEAGRQAERSAAAGAEGGPPRFAIKPRGHCIKLLQLLDDAAPGCRHIFLYRDGLTTVQSMTRAYSSESAQLSRYWLMQSPLVRSLFPVDAAAVKGVIVISDDPHLEWARSEAYFTQLPVFAKYALLWAVICRTYVQRRAAGMRIAACKLEDLERDRERFCAGVFAWCAIDAKHAALAALASSQAGDAHGASIFSRSRLSKFGTMAVDSPTLRRQLDEICDNCGVPRLGEQPGLLPGTLGHDPPG
ncbi:hypothetical protein T492DRAFT_993850 [Pavlovales sp. CCMP2436]|nr:hypothetical protein T492DRAFT_993850 [Pavlovales sp. CCMP2436]